MQFLYKKVVVDTINRSGQTFSIDDVVSFTINNIGNTDCYVSYKGESTLMKIEQGQGRDFPGDSGYVYSGEMQIKFIGSTYGLIEVVKSITSTSEN